MSRKTNKTNHVLNLLASGVKPAQETDPPAGQQAQAKNQAQAQAQSQASSVSIVHKSDDGVADQIRGHTGERFSGFCKTGSRSSERITETEKKQEKAREQLQKEKQEAENPAAKPAPKKAEAAPQKEEEDFCIVNVMEHLVKEKAPQYIRQFHVCECSRCLADVTALALTELPAKYVVINRSALSPLMNFYTTKYAGRITVEVTKACMAVQKNPHH